MKNEINYLCNHLYKLFYEKECPFLLSKDTEYHNKPIKIPMILMPLFWAGLMAFAYVAVLEMNGKNNYSFSSFWKFLLQKIRNIEIVSFVKASPQTYPALHFLFFQSEEEKQEVQIEFFKKIFSHSLAGVWGVYFPFLWEYFQKGLCPISFIYHLMTSEDPQKIIDTSLTLISQVSNDIQENAYFASTYVFLEDEKHSKVDFISFILKNGCENLPNKVKEEKIYS